MDEAAFEAIYNKHFDGIYRFLSKLCADPSLCEEMTQETFYQAYISLHRYNGKCEMFTWLAAIAKNTYFKYLRKNKITHLDLELAVMPDEEHSPEYILERRLEAAQVREAVRKLPPKYRDVVVLRIYAERSYAEVARLLGITENSAKVMFHRAKEILRKEIRL